jgi:4-amino-4-deoxy-L-arabinose transferase-like glycosyltransferase
VVTADSKHVRDWRPVLLVVTCAIAARAAYLFSRAGTDSFELPVVDAELFDAVARNFAAGRPGLTEDWFSHGVGYPLFLSLIYRLLTPSVLLAQGIQLLLGVGTSVATYFAARRVFGRTEGLVAGLIVAFYVPLIFAEGELLDGGLTALLAVTAVMLTLETAETGRWFWGVAWGAVGAIAVLIRATFLPFCVLALAALAVGAFRASSPRRLAGAACAGAVCGGLLLIAALVTSREAGRFTIMPAAAGLNLFIGNNAEGCRIVAMRPGLDWDLMVRMPLAEGVSGLWQRDDWFRRRALGFALHFPGRFLVGLGAKALALVGSREIPRNLDIYLFRPESWVLRAGVWKAGSFGFPFGVLLPLAVLGGVVGRRKIPWPFWLMLFGYASALVSVFVVGRYRIAVVPLLAVMAARGATFMATAVRSRRWNLSWPAGVAVFLAFVVTLAPWRFCAERDDLRPELAYLLAAAHQRRGDLNRAEEGYKNAIRLRPAYFEARHDLGRLLSEEGRFPEAAAQLREAAKLRPSHAPMLIDLGVALGRSGDPAGAVEALEQALRFRPDDPAVYNDLGMVAVSRKDFQTAAAQFQKAVELDPTSPVYRRNLERASADARRTQTSQLPGQNE